MITAEKINITLIIIICVLAWLIWLVQNNQKVEIIHLTAIQPDDVNTISIQISPEEPEHIFIKTNHIWLLSEPVKQEINRSNMNKFLHLVSSPVIQHYPLPDDKGEFGLDTPIIISINQAKIYLGKLDPLNQQRYIAINNTLYLIEDLYTHHLADNFSSLFTPEGK
jgi:hypothetical protein